MHLSLYDASEKDCSNSVKQVLKAVTHRSEYKQFKLSELVYDYKTFEFIFDRNFQMKV